MTERERNTEAAVQERPFERRRASLPQPDFTFYKQANAYPGPKYFFVGHSYNVELSESTGSDVKERANAIVALFNDSTKWVPVHNALGNSIFHHVLTRFEHDFLHRLPESALIGPAIDESGRVIAESFTVWREERRARRTEEVSLPGA